MLSEAEKIERAITEFHAFDGRTSAIYVLKNEISGSAYVGMTSQAARRWGKHLALLRCGKHHSPRLQEEFDEHGEAAFSFEVVEEGVDLHFAFAREQFWMWRFGDKLLNKSKSAVACTTKASRKALNKGYLKHNVSDEELLAEARRRGLID